MLQHSAYKKRKREDNHKYEEWKSTVVESNKQNKEKGNNIFFQSFYSFSPTNLNKIILMDYFLFFSWC